MIIILLCVSDVIVQHKVGRCVGIGAKREIHAKEMHLVVIELSVRMV